MVEFFMKGESVDMTFEVCFVVGIAMIIYYH